MNCPLHDQPFKLIPAGTSKKTGKPYGAFFTCQVMGCREKPTEAPKAPQIAKSSPTGTFKQGLEGLAAVEDGQSQGKRMNRSNMAARALTGVIQKQGEIPWQMLKDLEHWVDTGREPSEILTNQQEAEIVD